MEVDVPVIAVAIAALPAVALLLVVVTRLESMLFRDAYEEHRRAVIGDGYGTGYVPAWHVTTGDDAQSGMLAPAGTLTAGR